MNACHWTSLKDSTDFKNWNHGTTPLKIIIGSFQSNWLPMLPNHCTSYIWEDIVFYSFLLDCSQGSPDAYYLSLDGFTGPGGHPEQHGGLESRANGSCYCLEG